MNYMIFLLTRTKNHLKAGNNYPNWPHLQGGMKFSTQISPLLNLYITEDRQNDKKAERQTYRQKKMKVEP